MLTGRQKEITSYYYNDDLSLSEISELTGITRQGARECIKKDGVPPDNEKLVGINTIIESILQ